MKEFRGARVGEDSAALFHSIKLDKNRQGEKRVLISFDCVQGCSKIFFPRKFKKCFVPNSVQHVDVLSITNICPALFGIRNITDNAGELRVRFIFI